MEASTACAICQRASSKKCSACEKVYYCSKQHQKKDWKNHAKVCKPFKVAQNSILGRHYIATRNIEKGEIVLKDDAPLIAGLMYNCVPVCLQCYVVLQKSTAIPCTKCGWPLCENCKEHGSECDFTSSRRDSKVSITEFGHPHPTYQCINVIRSLALKKTNPEMYEKLLSLESHWDDVSSKENFIFEKTLNTVHFVKRYFKADDIPEEEIIKIMGILQINGHEVPLADPPYMAVYELASLLEHNCRANCSKSFTNSGGLIIHAAIPITKGDHISICYTDPLWGTTNRRHHLYTTKFFRCTCDRCRDPTEFGTMLNALKCQKMNCSGCMLPETFIDEDKKNYLCDTCESSISSEKVDKLLEDIGIHLSSMRKNDIKVCKEFINRYESVLHTNHYYNVDVTIALSQLIGQQPGGITAVKETLLIEKIDLCRRLDKLLRVLAPGI